MRFKVFGYLATKIYFFLYCDMNFRGAWNTLRKPGWVLYVGIVKTSQLIRSIMGDVDLAAVTVGIG